MMKPLLITLALLSAMPGAGHAVAAVPGHLIDPGRPQIADPDRVVAQFLEAVDRGELVVFGRSLGRSMIVPVRVDYAYELASRSTRVRIYSTLVDPLPVPGLGDCHVLAVSAAMEDGAITETESHVWSKD